MIGFVKTWWSGVEAKRHQRDAEKREAILEVQVAEARRDLGFFQIDADVPPEIKDRVADLFPVTAETLPRVRGFLDDPAMRALRGGIEERRDIEGFVRSLGGDGQVSFTLRDFAAHFGFGPQREASKLLHSPDLLGQVGYGTLVKGTTGAMIVGAAMVGTFKQSMHNGYITASVGGMDFSRHSSAMSVPERHAMALLYVLHKRGRVPERDYKGLFFAMVFANGHCDDNIVGDGLGGRSIGDKDLIAQRIGRHLVGSRIAPLEKALDVIMARRTLLAACDLETVDRQLAPLSRVG